MQKSCTAASSSRSMAGLRPWAMASMVPALRPSRSAIGTCSAHSTGCDQARAVSRMANSDKRCPIALR